MKNFYIGDGLYFSDDGYQIELKTKRMDYEHVVYMDSSVLRNFIMCVEKTRKLKITVERQEETESEL